MPTAKNLPRVVQLPCWAAMCAPLASCIAQLLVCCSELELLGLTVHHFDSKRENMPEVLYFLAYQNETMFEGGKWKQPISPYWSLGLDSRDCSRRTLSMLSVCLCFWNPGVSTR